MVRRTLALAAAAVAGCGSATVAELPPPARPAHAPALTSAPAGRVVALRAVRLPRAPRPAAVVRRRERVVELRGSGRRPAGVGPANVATHGGRLYVTDTAGDALLVYETRPRLELVRRVFLPGAPYGIAVDPARGRLWVTLTARNELVELGAHGRPHPLRTFPTVRQPDAVAVASGTVVVLGATAAQLLQPDGEQQR